MNVPKFDFAQIFLFGYNPVLISFLVIPALKMLLAPQKLAKETMLLANHISIGVQGSIPS